MKTQKKKQGKRSSRSVKPLLKSESAVNMAPRDPLLVQDFTLYEKMAHYNRERITEKSIAEPPGRM